MEIEPLAVRETYRVTLAQSKYLLPRIKTRMPQSRLRNITLRCLFLAFLRLIASGWRLKVSVGRAVLGCVFAWLLLRLILISSLPTKNQTRPSPVPCHLQ